MRSRTLRVKTSKSSPKLVVLQNFKSDIFTLKRGDVVSLVEVVDDHSLVDSFGIIGMVPSTYLKASSGSHKRVKSFDKNSQQTIQIPKRKGNRSSTERSQSSRINNGVVIEEFSPMEKGYLSVHVGDEVVTHKSEKNGWVYSEINGKFGHVPSSILRMLNGKTPYYYVLQDYGDFTIGDKIIVLKNDQNGWSLAMNMNSRCVDLIPSEYAVESPYIKKLIAFFDYHGEEGQLSFRTGDTVLGIGRINDDWWFGSYQNNFGLFPRSHVGIIKNQFRNGVVIRATKPSPAVLGTEKDQQVFFLEEIPDNKNWGRFLSNKRLGILNLKNITFEDELSQVSESDFTEKEFQMFQSALVKLQQQTKLTVQAILTKLENTDRNRLVLLSILKDIGVEVTGNDKDLAETYNFIKKNLELSSQLARQKLEHDIEESKIKLQIEQQKISTLNEQYDLLSRHFEVIKNTITQQ